ALWLLFTYYRQKSSMIFIRLRTLRGGAEARLCLPLHSRFGSCQDSRGLAFYLLSQKIIHDFFVTRTLRGGAKCDFACRSTRALAPAKSFQASLVLAHPPLVFPI
ncbi:MAG: hypothetical protein OIF38_08070, partial [Cellvibrionaceae bacterium]|nr:hypothetical protein [Cellvibrionaceae bacterium]